MSEDLVRRLRRAALAIRQSSVGRLVFLRCNDSAARAALGLSLRRMGLDRSLITLSLRGVSAVVEHLPREPQPPQTSRRIDFGASAALPAIVRHTLRQLGATRDAPVVLLYDLGRRLSAQESGHVSSMNIAREELASLGVTLVFALPQHQIERIALRAPDLWSWRNYDIALDDGEVPTDRAWRPLPFKAPFRPASRDAATCWQRDARAAETLPPEDKVTLLIAQGQAFIARRVLPEVVASRRPLLAAEVSLATELFGEVDSVLAPARDATATHGTPWDELSAVACARAHAQWRGGLAAAAAGILEAITDDPRGSPRQRAALLCERSASALLRGHPDQALRYIDDALGFTRGLDEVDPLRAVLCFDRGVALMHDGLTDEAAAAFSEAVEAVDAGALLSPEHRAMIRDAYQVARSEQGDAQSPATKRATESGPGALVAGRYRLSKVIGAGGYGAVWRGVDETTGRTVAVKLLHAQRTLSAAAETRFERGARALRRLRRHPNVVELFEHGVDRSVDPPLAYLVFEYIDAKDLQAVIDARAPLSLKETCTLLLPVMRGLAILHGMQLVHRDVKPANILCTQRGSVTEGVIVDFDIVRDLAEDSQLTGTELLGTLAYMSPERFRSLEPGPWIDVWAMGLVFYECLVGRLPWDNLLLRPGEFQPLISAIVLGPDLPRVTSAPDVSRAVADVIATALSRDHTTRYADMGAFHEALVAALSREAWFEEIRGRAVTFAAPPLAEEQTPLTAAASLPGSPVILRATLPAGLVGTAAERHWLRQFRGQWVVSTSAPERGRVEIEFVLREAVDAAKAQQVRRFLDDSLRSRYGALVDIVAERALTTEVG